MKRFLKILLAGALFFGLYHFCRNETKGFQLHRILSDLPFHPEWEVPLLNANELKSVEEILEQPFSFLGKGGSSYAFVSSDQKYVLKFFKHHHMSSQHQWLEKIHLPIFDGYRQEIVKKRQDSLTSTFASFKIAYEYLKEETGLLYVHLNKTDLFKNKKIHLIDKLGIHHYVPIDKMEFALQKKAEMAYPRLERLLKEDKIDEAKRCIDSMFAMVLAKCEKGVEDKDPVIERNFAFIDTQAIEIDLGAFYVNPEMKDPIRMKQEVVKELVPLKYWLQNRNAPLYCYVEEKLQNIH